MPTKRSKKSNNILKTPLLASLIVIIAIIVSILIPLTPPLHPIPSRDSGVFLYIGQQILEGKTPYLDIWDHKPPAIFYINAFGLLIGQGSLWGVWFVELISLLIASLVCFKLLIHIFNIKCALLGSVLWISCFSTLIQGGNLTTEYALPLQFLILLIYYYAYSKNIIGLYFIIGLFSGILMLLKPNLFGITVSVIAAIFILLPPADKITKGCKYSILISFGTFIPIIIMSIYFSYKQAFYELYDAVVIYNACYSATPILTKFQSIIYGSTINQLFLIILTGIWVYGLYQTMILKKNIKNIRIILIIALIDLPLELVLIGYSGRGYGHYFMSCLPSFAILTTYFFYTLLSQDKSHQDINPIKKYSFNINNMYYIILITALLTSPIVSIHCNYKPDKISGSNIITTVLNNTNDNDYVLVWGAETTINFLSKRESPSKYVYQYPLLTAHYQKPEMIEQFYREIIINKPLLIIDTSHTNAIVPPINNTKREKWINQRADSTYSWIYDLEHIINYIESKYEILDIIHPSGWVVYKIRSVESRTCQEYESHLSH